MIYLSDSIKDKSKDFYYPYMDIDIGSSGTDGNRLHRIRTFFHDRGFDDIKMYMDEHEWYRSGGKWVQKYFYDQRKNHCKGKYRVYFHNEADLMAAKLILV